MYIIVHKLLQSSTNTLRNHLDLDMDGIQGGFTLYCQPLGTNECGYTHT
jgi:hypothetical protein